jgi:hypothetical protein
MLNRIDTFIRKICIQFPSTQQHGFQKQLSCITTAFNLQETIAYHVDRQSDVYVAFLDQKGAFDSVRHQALFVKLGRLGLTGKTLRVIKAAYSNLQCKTRVSNKMSEKFAVVRGVRQGGVLSTFFYLVYVNDLINDLEKSNYGSKVMSVSVSNPTFADDIALIAMSPLHLQRLVDIVYRYCNTWNVDINVDKSNVVVFNKKRKQPQVGIIYGSEYINQTNSSKHLGILQESNMKLHTRINERIQKGKNAFYSMAGQGLHPSGVNPLVSVGLYMKIVIPTVLYASELWNDMSASDLTAIETFQHFAVKKIKVSTFDMSESMLGVYRLRS